MTKHQQQQASLALDVYKRQPYALYQTLENL